MVVKKYILNEEGNPVEVQDARTWWNWMEANKKSGGLLLADNDMGEGIRIMTGFLGLADNPEMLFATVVHYSKFGPEVAATAGTKEKALENHAKILQATMQGLAYGKMVSEGNRNN